MPVFVAYGESSNWIVIFVDINCDITSFHFIHNASIRSTSIDSRYYVGTLGWCGVVPRACYGKSRTCTVLVRTYPRYTRIKVLLGTYLICVPMCTVCTVQYIVLRLLSKQGKRHFNKLHLFRSSFTRTTPASYIPALAKHAAPARNDGKPYANN